MQIGVHAALGDSSTFVPGGRCTTATCAGGTSVDRVDLSAEQRVHARGVVGEVDDHDLVEVRLPGAPVVRVADVDALLARREALQLVRAGADVRVRLPDGGRAVADRDDAGDVLAERVEDRAVRLLQRQRTVRLSISFLIRFGSTDRQCRAAEEPELLVRSGA